MKITISIKDPDGIPDSVDEAVRESLRESGLDAEEADAVFDVRREKLWDKLRKFISHGEYIAIEFDTDADTATVVRTR